MELLRKTYHWEVYYMKKSFSIALFLALLGCMHSTVHASELLDVKPVVTGGNVSVEISTDSPMTYTYYKVPGQARAVVDIAEADPEKVEPLIVVNKGAVSSISVDKAQISGIVVSRIIFNLVSESDISATAAPDRKKLRLLLAVRRPQLSSRSPCPNPSLCRRPSLCRHRNRLPKPNHPRSPQLSPRLSQVRMKIRSDSMNLPPNPAPRWQ